MERTDSVFVHHPRHLVAVTRDEFVGLAPLADVSTAAPTTKVDWLKIAGALSSVVDELECPPSFRRGHGFAVTLPVHLGTGVERLITDQWFSAPAAPTLDLSSGELVDEHRWLAQVWSIVPEAALPIHLTVLAELSERERLSDTFATRVREEAAEALAMVPTAALWRSPLASAALYQASRPETPTATHLPWSRLLGRQTTAA